jgi:outer membrane receptor protein involved in Fe transport
VNIITRKPEKKNEFSAAVTGGSLNTRMAAASFENSDQSYGYRLSHTYNALDGFPLASGAGGSNDSLASNKAEFRGYWNPNGKTTLELFSGGSWDTMGQAALAGDPHGVFNSHFEMLKMTRNFGRHSALEVTTSRNEARSHLTSVSPAMQTRLYEYAAEVLHHFDWAEGSLHTSWGGSYRYSAENAELFFAGAPHQLNRIVRGFAHQSAKLSDKLTLVGGVSLEKSDTGGSNLDYQAAAVFAHCEDHSFRVSYSLSHTIPSLIRERGDFTPLPGTRILGNPGLEPEALRSYEAGYYGNYLDKKLRGEANLYYMEIRDRQASKVLKYFPVFTVTYDNRNRVIARGAELKLSYRPGPGRMLYINYTGEVVTDWTGSRAVTDSTPDNKINAGGITPLGRGFSASLNAGYKNRYFASASSGNPYSLEIPAYLRLDARLAYNPGKTVEIFVAGQNLTRPRHLEFADRLTVPRTYYAGASIVF